MQVLRKTKKGAAGAKKKKWVGERKNSETKKGTF